MVESLHPFLSLHQRARRQAWSHRAGVGLFALLIIALALPMASSPAADDVSGVVDVGVVASSDDAEELPNGYLDTTSSDLELVYEQAAQTVGIRFQAITIPQDALIDSAWVQFTVDEASTAPASLTIRALDAANPVTFSGTRGITTRTMGTTAVAWDPAPWPTVGAAGTDQRTPDLSPIIQALVTRGDWASGNALALILTGTGTRTAESFNGTAPPRLHIAWHTGGTPTTTTTTTTTTTVPTTTTTVVPDPVGTTRLAVIGDYGDGSARQAAVADMISAWRADAVVTTGDNVYSSSGYDRLVGRYYHEYLGSYSGSYGAGSVVNRFFPSLGNHDYTDTGLDEYLAFFDLPGSGVQSPHPSGNERYYDARLGTVHLFVLNSNLQEPDGLTPTTTQGQWLRNAMAASDAEWKIVVMHTPPYSSVAGKTAVYMRWPLKEWGADLVLSGDAHAYERLRIDGLDYAISGLGINHSELESPPIIGSQAFYSADDAGALLIVACSGSMHLEYRALGAGIVDTYSVGSGSCP